MSKLNINKETIINKLRNAKRYIGITAGILFAVGCSTGVVAYYSNMHNDNFPNEVIEEEVVSETTTSSAETVVTTTTTGATTTKGKVTTTLLTTLNTTTTAGTASIVSPAIVTTTTSITNKEPKRAPKVEKAVESTTTKQTTTVIESTTTKASSVEDVTDETATTTVTETSAEETTTTTSEPEVQNREYVVYKPSTHYVHRNTCRWFNDECYEIHSTEGLECRYCTECNPDIEIVTAYQIPTPTLTSLQYITDEERIYLCNTVAQEYGSDWVSLYDKACVVATVMNRVYDGGWTNGLPSTVYNVLTAPYQYNPAYAVPYYRSNVTQSCIDAVEYYFEHQGDFPHYTSFWGDGRYNYFR